MLDHGRLTANARTSLSGFKQLVERFTAKMPQLSLPDLFQQLLAEINYRHEIESIYKTAEEIQTRWSTVEEFTNALSGYCQRAAKPKLSEFFDEITLQDRNDGGDDKETQLGATPWRS